MPSSHPKRRFAVVVLLMASLSAACSDVAPDLAGPATPDASSAVIPGSPRFDQAVEAVLAVQARFGDRLMGMPGVVGTAVGLGAQGGPVLLVLVESARVTVPSQVGGVAARPLVTGRLVALQRAGRPQARPTPVNPAARFARPVPIGVSTGHPAITAGSIGARVKTSSGAVFALSNNHVYANENDADIGDAVIQPGTYDGGSSPADNIGTLADFEPIVFSTSASNVIDAAIASTSTSLLGNATYSGGYGTPRSTTLAPSLNLPVTKCGRTTGCTNGKVYAYNATVNIGYDGGTARFVNQIVITPGAFSAGGDSGSLIVAKAQGKDQTHKNKPVGLLFAGSNTVTIANPIDAVLSAFGVTIDGPN